VGNDEWARTIAQKTMLPAQPPACNLFIHPEIVCTVGVGIKIIAELHL